MEKACTTVGDGIDNPDLENLVRKFKILIFRGWNGAPKPRAASTSTVGGRRSYTKVFLNISNKNNGFISRFPYFFVGFHWISLKSSRNPWNPMEIHDFPSNPRVLKTPPDMWDALRNGSRVFLKPLEMFSEQKFFSRKFWIFDFLTKNLKKRLSLKYVKIQNFVEIFATDDFWSQGERKKHFIQKFSNMNPLFTTQDS